MKDNEIFRHLLDITAPWQISHIRVDAPVREVHVYLDYGKTWFGRRLLDKTRTRWRHVNLGSYLSYVYAPVEELARTPRQPFLGRPGSDFTFGLAEDFARHLLSGLDHRQVGEILLIDPHLTWQIRHSLEAGRAGNAAQTAFAEGSPDEAFLPPAQHPVWLELLENEELWEIRQLGLKLLLSRARQNLARLNDEQARLLKASEIRRFFIKHQSHLRHEIEQLRKHIRQGVSS